MHRTAFALLNLVTSVLIAPSMAAEFSGARALAYTAHAVGFGPRPAGSPALARLRAYVATELKTRGCQFSTDNFTGQTPRGPVAMSNLFCRFPGSSGQTVAITGHYDTKLLPKFVGANDGGSSTGFLLELARALQGAAHRDDVLLVFFDGEEAVKEWTGSDSLYGSRRLAEKWTQDGSARKIKALINVDMIGDRDLDLLYDMSSAAGLRGIVWDAADRLGYARNFPRRPSGIVDDHVPFLNQGIHAVDLIDFTYGPENSYWHTPQDTMDKLSAESFATVGRVVLETIHQLEAQ